MQLCDLVGLVDLNHEDDGVAGVVAGYLDDLWSRGVSGVRIDAAKHIRVSSLQSVFAKVAAGDALYRFQEVIYVTERAGATGNEDILSVHSDVRAQAMLQAQDSVLGFARFLGGSFAGSRAAGVSTDASGGLTSKKTAALACRCEVCGARLSKIQLWDLSQ